MLPGGRGIVVGGAGGDVVVEGGAVDGENKIKVNCMTTFRQ